jgi:hypothetical protein
MPSNRAIVLRERTHIRVVGALIGVLINRFFTHVPQLLLGRGHHFIRMASAARREAPKFIRYYFGQLLKPKRQRRKQRRLSSNR